MITKIIIIVQTEKANKKKQNKYIYIRENVFDFLLGWSGSGGQDPGSRVTGHRSRVSGPSSTPL